MQLAAELRDVVESPHGEAATAKPEPLEYNLESCKGSVRLLNP